jgi:hypothetical protein
MNAARVRCIAVLVCLLCLLAPTLPAFAANGPAMPLSGPAPASAAKAAAPAPATQPKPAQAQPAKAQPAQPPQLVFSDDFEAFGDSSQWRSQSPFKVQNKVVAHGHYAAEMTSTGGVPMYGRRTFATNYPVLYYRIRFNVISQGNTQVVLMRLRPSPNRSLLSITLSPTSLLGYTNESVNVSKLSDVVVSRGVWHELQIGVQMAEPMGKIQIWLDGTDITSLSGPASLGTTGISSIDLGDNSTSHVYDVAFDDIAVDTAMIPPTREADPISGRLTFRALPPLAGIPFELDGQRAVTNQRGIATIQVPKWSTMLRQRIHVLDSTQPNGSHTQFIGWREWTNSHDADVMAIFSISEPVSFSFVDLAGAPVEPSLVSSLVIKSNTGVILKFSGDEVKKPQLLTTSSVVPTAQGLRNKQTYYVVDQVVINGSDVVHRSQQRATFGTNRNWQISLLFYSVQFVAHDAFFHNPLGKEVRVVAADGSTQTYSLAADGTAILPRVPRGDYKVSVLGAGYSPPRPVTLTRDQAVDLEVVSKLDFLLIMGILGVFAIGLLLVGRPFIVTSPVRWVARHLPGRVRPQEVSG